VNRLEKLFKNSITDYIIIALGASLYAASVAVFTSKNNIAPGGLTGVSTMLNYLFSLPIGAMIFLMNIPLFLWAFFKNGKGFAVKTMTGTALVSVFIDIFQAVLPFYGGNIMLAAIFGGALSGLGLGLIFTRGGSTGGTDIIAVSLNKRFPHISTGRLMLLSDAVVLTAAAIVYGNIESALYAGITIFVSVRVIDAVTYGTSRGNGKLIFIISDSYDVISREIIQKLGRGVTVLNGSGAYTGNSKRVLMCAARPNQVVKITKGVKIIDKNAFIVVTTANSILGEGFYNSGKEK
jgi:uncharacterized membrane-anchored protein YitT (DUF2179 family)